MISVLDAAALVVAGAAAGLVGTAGGITSMISYPALLVVGLHARPASVANIVALVACWPGSALGSRPELQGKGGWLLRWTPVAAVGGAAGAVLLLSTPPGVFARVVPFLVATGAVALALEPRLTALRQRRRGGRTQRYQLALAGWLLVLSIYNGYFGAGAGVMTLALMLVFVDQDLPMANALKNMLIGAATLASAALFAISGSVDWLAALPLGAGMFAGSRVGPLVARRLPPTVLRWLIALLGIGLAVQLWLHPSA